MDELKAQAEALGIKVDARWSETTLRGRIAEAAAEAAAERDPPKVEAAPPAKGPPMLQVRLLKHYRPKGDYEVVGDPVEPPYPGVGFKHKLWAGTTVKIPADEARALVEHTVVSTEYVVDGDGRKVLDRDRRPMRREVAARKPIAERADPYTFDAA